MPALTLLCWVMQLLRNLTAAGKTVYGTEVSASSLNTHCAVLIRQNIVKKAGLHHIPFDDDMFDLVISSEVLEHVPEELVSESVSELVRVSRGAANIYLNTIYLPCSFALLFV